MQGMEGAWRVVCRVVWLNEAGSARYAGFSHKKRYKKSEEKEKILRSPAYPALLHSPE